MSGLQCCTPNAIQFTLNASVMFESKEKTDLNKPLEFSLIGIKYWILQNDYYLCQIHSFGLKW